MKLLKSALISVCLLLLCVSYLQAEQIDWEIANLEKVVQPPKSIALEYRFSEDQSHNYDVTVAGIGTLRLPGQESESKLQTNSELRFSEKVIGKAVSDGVWRISRKLTKGEMTLPDFGKMPVTAPPLEIEVDKYGAVRSMKGLDQLASTLGLPADQAMADILSQLRFVGFPKKELKVNDTWDDKYAVQLSGQKPIALSVTSSLVGFDRVMKIDCATIVTKYEAPFVFSLDERDGKDPGDAKIVEATATAQKSKALVGIEKGEFHTYFSYDYGNVVQSYGHIELTADLDTGSKATDDRATSPPPAAGAASDAKQPAVAPAGTTTPKHDLDVKYYVTSILSTTAGADAKQTATGGTR